MATREGALTTSKGNPAVADVLLAHEPIIERFGRDWHKTAVGQRIRVRGMLRVHVCGPAEQCLSSGEIPVLTPDTIEVLEPSASPVDELRVGEGLRTIGTVRGDGDRIEIVAPVRPENAAALRAGLRVQFRVESIPGVHWEAVVTKVETTLLRVTMDNMNRRLKNGMTGRVFVDLSPEPPPAPAGSR